MIEKRAAERTGDDRVDGLLDRLESAVSELVELDLDALVRLSEPSSGLHAVARVVERVRRRLGAFDAGYVGALESGSEPARYASPSTAAFLRDQLRLTTSEAKRRVRVARACLPVQSFSGEPLESPCPALARAIAAGTLSVDHADVVVKTLEALPEITRKEHGAEVEATLVAEAATLDPQLLTRLARHTIDLLDPDGTLRDADWQSAVRSLTLVSNRDGTGSLRAQLTAEALEKAQTVLGAYAKPVPSGPDGTDPRDPAKRMHDAFLDVLGHALNAGDLPASGGTPTSVVVHVREDQLEARAGLAVTDNGNLIPVSTALQLAGNSLAFTLVTTSRGVPLWLGRTTRIATPGQSVALAARDGGCAFPGCDRPPSMCERHHVKEWVADAGPTDIDDLVLLCGFHHREFKRRGWVVVFVDGLPWWIPPQWLDPERTPIRNTMHRPTPDPAPDRPRDHRPDPPRDP